MKCPYNQDMNDVILLYYVIGKTMKQQEWIIKFVSWILLINGKSGQASVAQRLEHWSCKPGVESSIFSGGKAFYYMNTLAWSMKLFISNDCTRNEVYGDIPLQDLTH